MSDERLVRHEPASYLDLFVQFDKVACSQLVLHTYVGDECTITGTTHKEVGQMRV